MQQIPKKQFTLGEQPDWAGTEDVDSTLDGSFVQTLIKEENQVSLLKRGYCLFPLDDMSLGLYSSFHDAFEKFSALPVPDKQRYAHLQFDKASYSPNQYHGFSVVEGLKEQFMMRIGGGNCPELEIPEDLGNIGAQLYENLDQICRNLAYKTMEELKLSPTLVDKVLDPVMKRGVIPTREGNTTATPYIPKGYISSSILDNFHYYNKFDKTDSYDNKQIENSPAKGEPDRFHNNHAAHTDSGLLTVVVTTDTPGLEVVDQQLGKWVAIERLIHKYVQNSNIEKAWRRYAIVFWSDSIIYLIRDATGKKQAQLESLPRVPESCLHRVQRCDGERFSVVFKQRTTPLTTPPRYQEDFPLAKKQLEAVDATEGLESWRVPNWKYNTGNNGYTDAVGLGKKVLAFLSMSLVVGYFIYRRTKV